MRRLLAAALMWVLAGVMPAAAQDKDLDALAAAATAGDSNAQLALGAAYHEGDGVVQSYAEAAQWFALAAEAGRAEAQNALGRYHHAGLGVERDSAAALRWLRAAADQGAPRHIFDLATVLEQTEPAQAAKLYAAAAEDGLVDAAVSLGVLYQNGTGVTQDLDRAFALYSAAALRGDARAQNNLGLLYVRGDGVAQDYARAAALFAAAAEQGLRPAMTNLGVMYENGYGVPINEAEAVRLTRLGSGATEAATATQSQFVYDDRLLPVTPEARETLQPGAAAGDPVAQFQLAWLLVTQPEAGFTEWREAAALFGAAADKGHAPAMVNLGQLHVAGRGVSQDFVLAQMWLLLASAQGHPRAEEMSDALQKRMTARQIEDAQARAAELQTRKSAVP